MNRPWKRIASIGAGAALSAACVLLAYFHRQWFSWNEAFIPEMYAAGLAAAFFWLRSTGAEVRERAFWRLWAAGCALWIVSDVLGMLAPSDFIVSPIGFFDLAFTFLPGVMMMAALVMRPEQADGRLRDPVVRYEAALIGLWWVYLYLVFVTPWHWVVPDPGHLWLSFILLHYFQDFILAVWLVALAGSSEGSWRSVYRQLACAIVLLSVTVGPHYRSLDAERWFAAMCFEGLQAAAFLALAVAAFGRQPVAIARPASKPNSVPGTGSLLISITVLGIPALAIWSRFIGHGDTVAHFRLLASFATILVGMYFAYRWHDKADRHRDRMLSELEASVLEVHHLRSQFAEAEKLASLGLLAAGAAHEINNPVAAMLGYAELLHGDSHSSPRAREMSRKIGEQARRIRSLVQNLISLGEDTSLEKQTVDLRALAQSTAQLTRLGCRQRGDNLQLNICPGRLEVRGDPDKLLQVFYRLLSDLGGEQAELPLEVRIRREDPPTRLHVEFIELAAPAAYPAPDAPGSYGVHHGQKGTGLSLSLCYAIIQEHAGSLTPETLPDGRRVLHVSLPVLPAPEAAAEPAAVGHPS